MGPIVDLRIKTMDVGISLLWIASGGMTVEHNSSVE